MLLQSYLHLQLALGPSALYSVLGSFSQKETCTSTELYICDVVHEFRDREYVPRSCFCSFARYSPAPVAVAAHEPAKLLAYQSPEIVIDFIIIGVFGLSPVVGTLEVCGCVCASECAWYMCTVCARSVHCRLHSIWARRKELRVLGCLAVDTSEISMAISKPSVI